MKYFIQALLALSHMHGRKARRGARREARFCGSEQLQPRGLPAGQGPFLRPRSVRGGWAGRRRRGLRGRSEVA